MYMPSLTVNYLFSFKSYCLTVSRFISYDEVTSEIIRSRDNSLLFSYECITLFFTKRTKHLGRYADSANSDGNIVDHVDLLVIGGGINGAGIARDAAGRGLKVVLCEKDDLAEGTSSRSGKLVHGGLRYLEYYPITGFPKNKKFSVFTKIYIYYYM